MTTRKNVVSSSKPTSKVAATVGKTVAVSAGAISTPRPKGDELRTKKVIVPPPRPRVDGPTLSKPNPRITKR